MNMMVFQEMPYIRPDMEAFGQAIREAAQALRAARTYEEARQACFEFQSREEETETLFSIAYVRNTIDTTDEYYEGEVKWLQEESAKMIPLEKEYSLALASCPFRADFEKEFGPQLMKQVDAALKTMDERIVNEKIREGELCQAYQKDSALAATDFRGEKCNFYGLLKHMESTDREERKEAYHAWAGLYEQISPKLDAQYDELVRLRTRMARTLGFETYTEMAYLDRKSVV